MATRPRPRALVFSMALALAGSLFVARASVAQTALGPNDVFIGLQAELGTTFSDAEVARHFNKARCTCAEPIFIYTTLLASGRAKQPANPQGNLQIWVGEDCDNPEGRSESCTVLWSKPLAELYAAGSLTLMTSAQTLSAFPVEGQPFTPNVSCTAPASFTQTVWALFDLDGDGMTDFRRTTAAVIDLDPPPPPDPNKIALEERDQTLGVNWVGLDPAVVPDLAGYQVLCNRGGSLQVFDSGTFVPGFESCPGAATGTVEGLDPAFVCGPLMNPAATSYPVKGLQDGIPYGVAVIAIDQHGNASAPELIYGRPVKAQTFYDAYRSPDSGSPGDADGGLCAVAAGDRSPSPFGGAALLVTAALILTRRRKHR